MSFLEPSCLVLAKSLLSGAFLLALLATPLVATSGLRVPTFLLEPAPRLLFGNDTGAQVSCTAHGSPPPLVTWVLRDGSLATQVPGLRKISGNGTLHFPPFLAQYYRTDVHEATYRCRASNEAGTVLSRNVQVQAVVRRQFHVHVENTEVYLGNSALIKCAIPEYVRPYVRVASWHRGEEILLPDLSDVAGRYVVLAASGDLYVRSVRSEDGLMKFSCLVTNTLNGERQRSDAVMLQVKELSKNLAPRTTQKPVMEIHVERGNDVHLPCNIQGNPFPIFTWYRVSDSAALYPIPSSQRVILSRTLLLIKNADERDAGKWICQASNQFGEQRIEIRLSVNSYVSVHILPQVQIVNSGGTANFNCTTTGSAIDAIDWMHNGKPLQANNALTTGRDNIRFLSKSSLLVENVGRRDRGVYQCLVENQRASAQAMAELKLGDTVPELIYTFIEQNVRPGPLISLKCSASGSPPPQFAWLLDSQPIMDVSLHHRFAIGQFVDMSGDVISHLNISHVRPDDGGLYKCVASNSMGSVLHSARLNVYGPPYVRAIGPIKAVAGEDIIVHCPFAGYPVEQIRWEKAHQELTTSKTNCREEVPSPEGLTHYCPIGKAGNHYELASVADGGQLVIKNVEPGRDQGIYTCIVRSRAGEEARRDMQLNVNSPPVIEPFKFPKNLQEGGRAQITCAVSSGDMPIYFSWKKDDSSIPSSLQITEKKEEFYSLLVFKDISARHSGKYTCFASNAAAKVNYTAELQVRVAPRWSYEPMDTAIMLGNTISINCEAEGYPIPAITWFKGQGKGLKDFKPLSMRNHSLLLNLATDNDEGYYMCQATNEIGAGLKKTIRINVNEPARFEQSARNISSRRNDPVTLDCHAKGDEPITIGWTHNNGRIDLNNFRFSIAEMKTEKGVDSQLTIGHSDRHDSGVYRCIAENPYGRAEQIIFLAVQERPDTPSHLEVFEVGSRTVKLSWRRPFDGNSPVLSYLVQYQSLKYLQSHATSGAAGGDWSSQNVINVSLPSTSISRVYDSDLRESAIVAGLTPATTFLIRMQAINEIERSAYTEAIVLKTQEEAPTEAPSNVQVQTGGESELIVTWQIPPRESWNGELIGYTVNCSEEKQNINFISVVNSSLKSTIASGWATTKATLRGLRKYTRYAVTIRAMNSFGSGPWSAAIFGTTAEGVPEAAPQNVNCTALSSQSLKISWLEPPLQFHGGIIQGYKILYRPIVHQIDFPAKLEIKRTSNLETYLHTLHKASNYSIRVLAYTATGDGLASHPLFCQTDDDVPDAPASIKAAALTADSILISWLTPKNRNGIISHYTVYAREAGRKGQAKTHMVRVDENGYPVIFEARSLAENQMYEFWVSASTSVGEGEPTSVIAQATNTRAPARIASFGQVVRKAVGTSLLLECLAVGNPTPRARWLTRDRPVTFSPFYEVTNEGNLKIHRVEGSLSGNYTCTANNLFGNDEIQYQVIAMKPPAAPQIIVQYASADSIRVSWDAPDDGGAPLQGYTISYHTAGESWSITELLPENNAYTISQLKCGNQYIIKMSAHNMVGSGVASEEINVWTKGKASQAPNGNELIATNATCVNLKLSSWQNGGCSIHHFSIEHRPLGDIRWTVVTSDISNAEENRENLIFCDFLPAKWYQLRISATNDAGKTTEHYHFSTTNIDGITIPPPSVFPSENDLMNNLINATNPTSGDWFATLIVVVIITVSIITIALTIKHRRTLCGPIAEGYESRTLPGEYKEDHENRRNQQVYSASPVKTVDKGNESEMYEISPYATFSVNGGRTGAPAKTPTRAVAAQTPLDYTMQFKTFGHPEGENLNATAYPLLPSSGFGHVKSKSSWHKQRYYNTEDESTLSKSMTIVAGSQAGHSKKSNGGRSAKSSAACSGVVAGSESDTSISPSTEFSNMPTYRVPCKSSRSSDGRAVVDMFRPDSSTESNNDQGSPAPERRHNTPRHVLGMGMAMGLGGGGGGGGAGGQGEKRSAGQRSRKHGSSAQQPSNQTLERRKCPGSSNR
ncbi:Down syndrome cell adhesion molecule-like protein Dscam2 isoform X1 [Drosophila ficusphila]|uniref:Down syndrome cell adhesion molecule-like protein Dscam2 isoform X1 n=1 Tax=Drosophila ficusphila TaxID=30025 RepID=UPI0007E81FA6|nr:Down syndrome cell adhesion molecule-like protein Dscam2 isoform X1 [Drosophila ficusphila]XP_017047145.1 Down syndrome cell adhesion molecule-like protein Dscam2 isoform X1 [Drosophila ficusphila]XP_017047146.1 Down syndrome cell adhesion molecule-like protein Dscam2 isoform X1 [Drosophila ficusphila]